MQSERITIRLPATMTGQMDGLIAIGKYGNRTEIIRRALFNFLQEEGAHAKELMQSARQMQELQAMAAQSADPLASFTDSL